MTKIKKMHPNLRAPQDSDATWLLDALNDQRTNHALIDMPHPYPEEFMREFWLDDTEPLLQFVWLDNSSLSRTCWGISSELLLKDPALPRGDDKRIGYIWLSATADDSNAEFSFLLHPNFQKQGLGLAQLPDIFRWLAPHMQQQFGITNITAHARPNNAAAQKVLQACEFKLITTASFPIVSIGDEILLQKWLYKI